MSSSHRFIAFGEVGVTIFFVISGFLITTLLLRERERTGGVSLRNFYVRRTLRIFPAFYVYLGVMALIGLFHWTEISGEDLAYSAFYLMDFHSPKAWKVVHLWSLAVEEQFYLVWPCVLVFLGTRRALHVAVVGIVLGPALRVGAWLAWPEARGFTDRAFPFVFDALAMGCALAIVRARIERCRWYIAVLESPLFWLIPAAAILSQNHHVSFELGAKPTIVSVAAAMMIHRFCLRLPMSFASRVLESRALIWVGVLSYSLYLWQQPFFERDNPSWYTKFPINIVLALTLASLSYYLVERPVLRLRTKYRANVSPGALLPARASLASLDQGPISTPGEK